MPRYIAFVEDPKREGRTRVWMVVSKHDSPGVSIGEVRWHGAWRQYAFFPKGETVFNPECLRDIAVFIEGQMRLRRTLRRRRL